MTIEAFTPIITTDHPKSDPIYRQIAQQINQLILNGTLTGGGKLPTHRALADHLAVTVGTVTRAYAEAERQGLVEARIGAGTFVSQTNKPNWVYNYSEASPADGCNFG